MGFFNRSNLSRNIQNSEINSVSSPNLASQHESSFIQDYFHQNKLYFQHLLGNRLNHRECLVESDMPILKEAYDKAHQKTQFEIDLHWKRTTHIWTLILALLFATGTILGLYLTAKTDKKDFFLCVTLIFSIISIIVSNTSISMLRVSHQWCRNWELHVVMLEPLFSGRLYQTHLGIGKTRLSMSKLNSVFIWIAYASWMLLFQLSILLLSSNIKTFLIATFVIYALISFCRILIGHAILTKDEENIPYELTKYGIKAKINYNNSYLFLEKTKIIFKHIFYFIAFMIALLIAYYILLSYSAGIDIQKSDLENLMSLDVRILFPALFN
ncbi:hypothetical protein UXO74_02785 [Enterobacter cloacae]|uniref:RipA family octameric membrane protein n=1 Tax=Enterobacter cloacae TaxID=550 RepID=UPI002FD239D7